MPAPGAYLPDHIRRRGSSASRNQVPLQFEGCNGYPFEGTSFFVSVPDVEHATLCRAFRLDQARFWFDAPSTFRGIGSSSGSQGRGGKNHIHGFVFMSGRNDPVARFRVVDADDRYLDRDPLSDADLQDLANWVRR